MQELANKTSDSAIATVEEKIHLEKQLPFDPKNKTGPTTELYFHELTTKKHLGQKILRYVGGIILGILFVLTLPLIALLIKCTSRESVFRKITVPGRRGISFQQYQYPTKHSDTSKSFLIGSFLNKSGLYKLPSVINIWKGDLNLVGPRTYPQEWCNNWNNQLSDYYKRFALHPGFLGVAKTISNSEDIDEVASSLEKELKYIHNPSFKKDFKRLFGIF